MQLPIVLLLFMNYLFSCIIAMLLFLSHFIIFYLHYNTCFSPVNNNSTHVQLFNSFLQPTSTYLELSCAVMVSSSSSCRMFFWLCSILMQRNLGVRSIHLQCVQPCIDRHEGNRVKTTRWVFHRYVGTVDASCKNTRSSSSTVSHPLLHLTDFTGDLTQETHRDSTYKLIVQYEIQKAGFIYNDILMGGNLVVSPLYLTLHFIRLILTRKRKNWILFFAMYSQFSFPLTAASVWLCGSHITIHARITACWYMLLFWRKDKHTCTYI